jgi:hypothetical protein
VKLERRVLPAIKVQLALRALKDHKATPELKVRQVRKVL